MAMASDATKDSADSRSMKTARKPDAFAHTRIEDKIYFVFFLIRTYQVEKEKKERCQNFDVRFPVTDSEKNPRLTLTMLAQPAAATNAPVTPTISSV